MEVRTLCHIRLPIHTEEASCPGSSVDLNWEGCEGWLSYREPQVQAMWTEGRVGEPKRAMG